MKNFINYIAVTFATVAMVTLMVIGFIGAMDNILHGSGNQCNCSCICSTNKPVECAYKYKWLSPSYKFYTNGFNATDPQPAVSPFK